MRPTALLVADASGALGILVGVPAAELAEARSTPRATESVVASEEAQSAKFPSHPRSAAPSPSPIAEIRAAEEPTPVSVVSAVSRSRAPAAEIPASYAPMSACATSGTSKTPLVTVGAALFVKSLCLCCEVECVIPVLRAVRLGKTPRR